MIKDHDRSYFIGASDTNKVMGNYNTETFKKWWMTKLGINKDSFTTKAMKVGNAFEHKILETLDGVVMDEQILLPELGLRVNYDGRVNNHIYEVKTTAKEVKVSKAYIQQSQVEMFAYKEKYGVLPDLSILFYQVNEDDYENYFMPIDKSRLQEFPIVYDPKFIEQYKVRLKYLHECIEKGVMPK